MPGSWTSPDRPGARANALVRVAFRGGKRVGVRDYRTFAAQWLACTIPCRRFADTLAGAAARLGADVDRYSFIVVDSHHLLLASLPAHSHGFWCSRRRWLVPNWVPPEWPVPLSPVGHDAFVNSHSAGEITGQHPVPNSGLAVCLMSTPEQPRKPQIWHALDHGPWASNSGWGMSNEYQKT